MQRRHFINTTLLKGENRGNGGKDVHFSRIGLIHHGEAWADKIVPWAGRSTQEVRDLSQTSKSQGLLRANRTFGTKYRRVAQNVGCLIYCTP